MRPATLTKLLITFLFVLIGSLNVAAEDKPKADALWPGDEAKAKSRITVYHPAEPNGTAVVICPGGGYGMLVAGPEGHGIAKWLNQHNITGIVLEYALPRGRPEVPLADAQRALRTVRANAEDWRIDPERIGIMGFSAGGHLASAAGTHFVPGDPDADDAVDRVSSRPDFMVLVYPVISMGEKGHRGSRRNLLGNQPSPELVEKFSSEKQVTEKTPPAFLAHALDDRVVSPDNSAMFHAALKKHGVNSRYLELPSGDHGLNRYQGPMWDRWQAESLKWLEQQQLVTSTARATDVERQVFDYMGYGEATVLRLWPEGSERNKSINGQAESGKLTDKLRITNIEKPSLLVYPPPAGVKKLDAAVIHCPGGGYNYLAMANPKQFVAWMHELGVTVAVLKYHTPRGKDDPNRLVPLADAQRAVRVLREHAADFGLSPDKIGIAGASAGGHLAFNACLNHDNPVYEAIDEVDKLSCRPAFGMLFYPAYLGKDRGSITGHPDLAWYRLDKDKTPPIFMTINGDDRGFVSGNLAAMAALGDKRVPAELHLWTKGGHSGCFDKYPLAEFARPGARFLARHDVLPEAALATSDDWLDTVIDKLVQPVKATNREAPKPPAGLDDNQLSAIDREIRKAAGKSHPVYRLWPGDGTRTDDTFGVKGEKLRRTTKNDIPIASDITAPTMTFFPADKPNGRGVLVFPGGGYNILAWDHEGVKVARWLNDRGISAFVVKYRTPRRQKIAKHAVALQDAQRAIRLVRAQAELFGIAPDKIGVLGFSAGGHLAALASTAQATPSYKPIDEVDEVSVLPDFSVLIYPAYTADKDGKVDPLLIEEKPSVPTFIATAADDPFTREQYHFVHSRLHANTPIAFHVYETGGHGKGILPGPYAFSQWHRECARWLEDLDRN